MTHHLKILLFLSCTLLVPGPVLAGVEQISEPEFRKLALELAPKVTLFREVWKEDPKAEFYGGTSRDYLYWLKGKFREARTPAEAKKIAQGLRAEKVIDHRLFLFSESDVDIVTPKAIDLSADEFGVRKIDFQSGDVFDPKTTAGFDDRHQGFIPAEKIRLSRKGLITNATAGDGVREIYQGKLSVRFAPPEDFAKTTYAKSKENHPILLAARYLRLQAMNYYQNYGGGYPDPKKLMEGVRPEDAKAVKAVIAEATRSSDFASYLAQPRLRSWLNGSIRKAFRSYTNPTAAMELFREFGMDNLVSANGNHLEPINQYLFAKSRDEKKIAAFLSERKVSPKDLYEPAGKFFPDGYIYHGTRQEDAFRGILLQGILPSESGLAGAGLYGVAEKNKSFSEDWGRSKDRLVRLPVKPEAKIVDIENGLGRQLWASFGGDFESFAEAVGADMLRYPYEPEAFVVKNSGVLGKPEGVYRRVVTLSEVLGLARENPAKAWELLLSDNFTTFSSSELTILLDVLQPDSATLTKLISRSAARGLKDADLVKLLQKAKLEHGRLNDLDILELLHFRSYNSISSMGPEVYEAVGRLLEADTIPERELMEFFRRVKAADRGNSLRNLVGAVLQYPGWEKHPEIIDAFLASPEFSHSARELESAFAKPHWYKSPRMIDWLEKIGDPSSSLTSQMVLQTLTKQPDSPRKAALIQKFVEHGSRDTDLELLRSVFSQGDGTREQLETILDRTGFTDINITEFVKGPLSRPPWNQEIAWVEKVSRKAVRTGDIFLAAELAKFFSQNYFPGRADLLKPLLPLRAGLIGYDEMQAALKLWSQDPEIAAYLKGQELTQSSLEGMLKARGKGNKARKPASSCAPDFAQLGR